MLRTLSVLLAAVLVAVACGSRTGSVLTAPGAGPSHGDSSASRRTTVPSGSPSGSSATLAPDQTIHVRSPFVSVATPSGVCVSSDKAVVHIDPTSGTTYDIPTPVATGAASGLAASPGVLWEADFETGAVEEIDVQAHRVTAAISVGNGPRGVLIDGATPWVFEEKASREAAIDAGTHRIKASVAVPGPVAAAFGSWWSTSADGSQLDRLDPGTSHVIATIPMPATAGACELNALPGLAGVGDAVATFCLGDAASVRPRVAVVSVATNRVIATVDPQGQPFGGSVVVNSRWWLIEGPVGGPGRFVRVDQSPWAVDRTLLVGSQFDPDAGVVLGDELYIPIDPGENLDEVLRFPLSALSG